MKRIDVTFRQTPLGAGEKENAVSSVCLHVGQKLFIPIKAVILWKCLLPTRSFIALMLDLRFGNAVPIRSSEQNHAFPFKPLYDDFYLESSYSCDMRNQNPGDFKKESRVNSGEYP